MTVPKARARLTAVVPLVAITASTAACSPAEPATPEAERIDPAAAADSLVEYSERLADTLVSSTDLAAEEGDMLAGMASAGRGSTR